MWEPLPCGDSLCSGESPHGSGSHIQRFLLWIVLLASAVVVYGEESTNLPTKKVAAVVTVYHHTSHADLIVSRLFQTDTLDGKGKKSPLTLAALYVDQFPKNDVSRKLAGQYHFPIYDKIADALTLGTGKLAVDGVLLVAEHGDYPDSDTGAVVWPKRRIFEEIVKVFEKSGRSVPVFIDKHIADNWTDAKWMYDTAQRLKIPLMAGSSLPVLWRHPDTDVERGAKLKEVVAVSYHTLDGYGFHALEMLQCLVERRRGGETGIKAVQCLTGNAVWEAGEKKLYDPELLKAALARMERSPKANQKLKELVNEPVLFAIEYADGLRASVLTLNGAVGEWSIAWRYWPSRRVDSTLFWTQEWRPLMHFTYLLNGIEQMMLTGKPTWPVERTLLTSGALDALLISKKEGGKRIETPQLQIRYKTDWNWHQPPPPPPNRPLDGP